MFLEVLTWPPDTKYIRTDVKMLVWDTGYRVNERVFLVRFYVNQMKDCFFKKMFLKNAFNTFLLVVFGA